MILTLAVLLAVAGPIRAAEPARLTRAAADSVRRLIEHDRAETEKWLKTSPTSYLGAVQRLDFGQRRTLVVGSAGECDVHLEGEGVAARHLAVTVVGDSFGLQALGDAARFKVGEAERREAVVGPSSIGVGRFTLRLSHQRFPAVIVFDPRSPGYARYKGLRYFPVDLSYRYVLPLTPNPEPDTVIILSTRGHRRRAVLAGWFDFKLRGRPCRLEATRLLEPGVDEHSVSVFFRDATTGKQTYGVGRYVDPTLLPNGLYELDFNRAYNPACAFSPYYNCPLPRQVNTLTIPVPAGEMDTHYIAH